MINGVILKNIQPFFSNGWYKINIRKKKTIVGEETSYCEEMTEVPSTRNTAGFVWGPSEKKHQDPGALVIVDGWGSLGWGHCLWELVHSLYLGFQTRSKWVSDCGSMCRPTERALTRAGPHTLMATLLLLGESSGLLVDLPSSLKPWVR